MKEIAKKYRHGFADRRFVIALVASLVLVAASLIANYYAATYATGRESNFVTDIILSNIPVFDVDNYFVYGPIIFWAIIAAILLIDPKKIPFTLKSIALFVLVRSIFITLTHIGPYPDHTVLDIAGPEWLRQLSSTSNFFLFSSGGDLFFSGHTGLPFLMALVFWRHHFIRALCLIASIFFAVVVLLGHLHYSIDVLAAFFITYSVYHIALRLFKNDRRLFLGT